MSISKKLAAVVSAAAVVASMFAAAPANAQTASQILNSTIGSDRTRIIDSTTHQVQYYAGEMVNLSLYTSVSANKLNSLMTAGQKITVSSGISVVSGTMAANGYSGIMQNASMGANAPIMTNSTALVNNEKTYDSVPSNLSVQINYSYEATTDVVLTFNPTVTVGTTVLANSDYNYFNPVARLSRVAGAPSQNTVVGKAADERIFFYTNTVCIDTSSLTAGDVLEGQSTVQGAAAEYYWSVNNAQGMPTTDGMETTFTVPTLQQGESVRFNASARNTSIVAGTTYSLSNLKVVKQGTTTDLSIACGETLATGTLASDAGVVKATLDITADGMNANMYYCSLYATTDTAFAAPVASGYGSVYGPTGPTTTPVCSISGAPSGTYKVAIRVDKMGVVYSEKVLDGTVTVVATTPVTPAKKAPKVPTVATKLKAGKTIAIALHATKGSATKGANADGLATVVTVAASSKAICLVTKVVKSKKITGYTVKGLKAGKCSVVVTITGNATYASLTKTVAVTVSK